MPRRFAGGTVSSKRSAISASVAAPNTATPSSVARQPNRSDSRPPSGALAQAITPRPLRPLDMARAASTGWYRSRTTARAAITPAPIAAPCTVRQTISRSIDAASALPTEAAT
jgi:hypothetical protein